MSKIELVKCNSCGKEEPPYNVNNWYHLELIGRDLRTFGVETWIQHLPVDLCSEKCLFNYLGVQPKTGKGD